MRDEDSPREVGAARRGREPGADGRLDLRRITWTLALLPVLLLALHETYQFLTGGIEWPEVLLDTLVVLGGGEVAAHLARRAIVGLANRFARQQERLEWLSRADAEAGDPLDREDVVQTTLEAALRLVPASVARILTYDPEQSAFVAGWERDATGEGRSITDLPRMDGFSARVIQVGRPLIVERIGSHPMPLVIDADGESAGLLAGVALVWRGQALGVLSIGFDAPHTFSGDELDALLLLGRKTAVALENARRFEASRRERKLANALLDAADTLSTTLRLDQLLENVLDELLQVVPYDAASINLLRDEHCWPVAVRGAGHVPARRFVLSEIPLVQQVVHRRTSLIVADVRREPRAALVDVTDQTRGWLGVPLVAKDQVIGVLMMDSRQPGAFGDEDARLVSAFARQAALAIDNSRLYEQARAQLREATLLHGVTAALASTLDVDQLLPYVAHSLCELLNGDAVEICTVGENPDEVTVVAEYTASGTPDPGRATRTISLSDAPAATEAMRSRTPVQVWLGDSETDSREQGWLEANDARVALILPIVTRGRALGFARVRDSHAIHPFGERDVAVGETLLHPAAIALENARLFGEVEDARNELQARAGELQEANARLQELDQLKNRFLAIMGHELRTPLSSVVGFSEVLLEGSVGKMSDDQRECVEIILVNANHILILVNDLLDLSRIEAGSMSLDPAPFNVDVLLKEAKATIRPLIEEKSQVLTIECAKDMPPLSADRFRVKQVLLNLLSNAQKFTPEEGHITLSCHPDNADLLFSVADTGIGIAPEDHDIIFEEFRQARRGPSAREITGSGLGLAISKRLIELHGGRIWVESTFGQGATFYVALPLDSPMQAATAGQGG